MAHIPRDRTLTERAKSLRKEMTPQERHLWFDFLRVCPAKIYRQRIIGPFIADFYCAKARLVVELDGSQHYEPQGLAYDAERTAYLESLGLRVLRFLNSDVDLHFASVCEQIDLTIKEVTL